MTTAFQRGAFQFGAFQIGGLTGGDDGGGLRPWKPRQDHVWPDLAGEILAAVRAAAESKLPPEPALEAMVEAAIEQEAPAPQGEQPPRPIIDFAGLVMTITQIVLAQVAEWDDDDDEAEAATMLLIH